MINQQITLSYSDFYGHPSNIELNAHFEGTSQAYASSLIQIMNANEQVYNGTEKLINYLRMQWFSRDNVQLYLQMEAQIRVQAKKFPETGLNSFG